MANVDPDTDDLLRSAARGDQTAIQQLLNRHRQQLTGMVAIRMDRRLTARFDPSDVIQEALIQAAERLPRYLREQPMPFYPWIRNIAWEQLVKLHEQHVSTGKRSVAREQRHQPSLSDESVGRLVDHLATSASGPTERLLKQEVQRRTRSALKALPERDREILELRYLEQLDNRKIAAVLGVTIGAVRTRHFRAIQRLHDLLGDDSIGENHERPSH